MFLQAYDEHCRQAALHRTEMGKAARHLIPDDVGKVFAGAFRSPANRKGTLRSPGGAAA